jgi:ubiquinone/menaquinone biosynthesis C-methylase UbiE
MQTAIYDKIGSTYDQTRRADPQIVSRLLDYLQPRKEGFYLDIGCGSGNYTNAIFEKGFEICGLDISTEMLKKAKQKNPHIKWIQSDACTLPFRDAIFNGAICVLATHHIRDIEAAFCEIFRVLKEGFFVVFTAFPDQMEKYWLKAYFPDAMRRASEAMATQEEMFQALRQAGFENIRKEVFYVNNELQDWFLHAGKYRPQLYLDPMVRAGISTFSLAENQEEIQRGCARLEADIASQKIESLIQSYESPLGDYAFVIGEKRFNATDSF